VFESAVSVLAVFVAEVGVVFGGDGFAAACAWLSWLEGGEELCTEGLVWGAVAAPGGVGSLVGLLCGVVLAGWAAFGW
jgi:hypothetical protein